MASRIDETPATRVQISKEIFQLRPCHWQVAIFHYDGWDGPVTTASWLEAYDYIDASCRLRLLTSSASTNSCSNIYKFYASSRATFPITMEVQIQVYVQGGVKRQPGALCSGVPLCGNNAEDIVKTMEKEKLVR